MMTYDFGARNRSIITARNQRVRREQIINTPVRVIKERPNSVLFTGGIGDVLALECFFSQYERDNTETIFYATRKSQPIIEIFKSLNTYPRLKNHIVVWDDFSKFWCFYSKDECIVHMKLKNINIPHELLAADDWSIMDKFSKINSNYMKYNKSSVLMHRLCNIHEFDLPSDYFVICPYSTDKRDGERDFNHDDWNKTIILLRRKNIQGVVLNQGADISPVFDEIIDLSNQTTIIEAMEILKAAKGFIGVNSVLSVIAAKLFNFPNLHIKSRDDHCFKYKHIYYAPQSSFNFISDKISCETLLI